MSVDDLIFSDQANHKWPKILGELKRSNLSITNRLRSIRQDADFVQEVSEAFNRPLVANERCGSWYIEPRHKAASAYFKSTDGHTGQWKFSTRRLNLHLLPLINKHDGIIIVDSTRRGKRMPDALSKTIPIWCCVLNRVLFPEKTPLHDIYVPPNVVSDSEKSQMLARVPQFIESFNQLGIDVHALGSETSKPLRPVWVTQETDLMPTDEVFEAFHPVICCTSSRRVTGTEMSEGGYIQGAGDDTENWALGLTPAMWWDHATELLEAPESELPELIASLVSAKQKVPASATKQLSPYLLVTPLGSPLPSPHTHWCRISLVPETTKAEHWTKSPRHMEIGVGKQRLAGRNLRLALPQICSFVSRFLRGTEVVDGEEEQQKRILIECETGKDLSVGVALAISCWCFDDEGNPGAQEDTAFTKALIRVRLGRIMTTMPEANPSRATLQSVNSFLMDWRR